MPKYTAKQSIGHFMPGDEIKGLESNQLQALLASGAIEEYQEPEEQKEDGTAARLAELEKANTDLTAANQLMTDEKVKSDQENTALKAKVAELEKAVADSQAALKKAIAEAKKAATAAEK
jgi:lia operon protein LiaH